MRQQVLLGVVFISILASSSFVVCSTAYAVTDFSLGVQDGKQKAQQDEQNNDTSFNVDEYTKADGQCQQQEGHSFSYCAGFASGYHTAGADNLFR